MKISFTIFLAILSIISSTPTKETKKYNTVIPDSLIESAVQHMTKRVGINFFQNHIRFFNAIWLPLGSHDRDGCRTVWIIEFPSLARMMIGVDLNLDGSLRGKIRLPNCYQNPGACNVSVDRSTAINIAEEILKRKFHKNAVGAHFGYSNGSFECFTWDVNGSLLVEDEWTRTGTVRINASDGSIIYVHECKDKEYFPEDQEY